MLARQGLRADKALGQHFLVSQKVVSEIVARCEGLGSVLEIGPGPGALTGPLSDLLPVVAIELDARMVGVLVETAPNARIVPCDALDADWGQLMADSPRPRGIVSNMPYNITGPLLDRVCHSRGWIAKAVLMMQREVAEKILAQANDRRRGALSVTIQALFDVHKVCHVPPGAFSPPPKVESTVLELIPKPEQPGTEAVLALVRAGFTQPRKTLANNLAAILGNGAKSRIEDAGMSPSIRAHELTWEMWCRLRA